MILDSDRSHAVDLNNEAVLAGAAKFKACDELDINVRTFQHWVVDGAIKTDGRPKAIHPEPKNKLSSAERERLLDIVNSNNFNSMAPRQIVLTLADDGIYIASESTYYRVLHVEKLQNKRGRSQVKEAKVPTNHTVIGLIMCGVGISRGGLVQLEVSIFICI